MTPGAPAPLKVKPILVYEIPQRRHQTSWRSWGGIATEADAREEVARIQGELAALAKKAEFPLEFLPVSPIRQAADVAAARDIEDAHVLLVYAAGGWMDVFDALDKTGKDRIFFCRHKSGPVYLWYEIISPRYLRQHTDTLAVKGVDEDDVVIDSPGRDPLAAPGPGRAPQHHGHEDPGRRRPGRLGPAGRRRSQARRRQVEVRHRHRALRGPGPAHPPGPGRRRGRAPGAGQGRRLPPPGRDEPRDRAAVRRERPAPRRGLPGPHEGGRLPGPDHQRLHGDDHAPGRDLGLPHFEHAQRRRLPGLLRIGLRGHPVRGPARPHRRAAGVPQRPDLPARRHHHAGPLHGPAEDGRPDDWNRPAS